MSVLRGVGGLASSFKIGVLGLDFVGLLKQNPRGEAIAKVPVQL